ncbi:MAG: TatD family hydrolase [Candidatus Woesearchaeota archaeon]
MLVDTHCHLNHADFKQELDKLIEESRKGGVKRIISSGVNSPTNKEVLEIAKRFSDIVRATAGIYPIDALGLGSDEAGLARQVVPIDLEQEFEFIKQNKDNFIAIGECGLDYHWVKDKKEEMKRNFEKIISFVEKIKKPIVIHSRKAEEDCINMLQSSSIKKVQLHCFWGRKSLVKRGADLGYYFSIPANANRQQHFQMIINLANINQLLTETDAPWLSPIPQTRNEPKNVIFAIREIAKIKKMTEEETINNIWKNYQNFFDDRTIDRG